MKNKKQNNEISIIDFILFSVLGAAISAYLTMIILIYANK
jgi:hypothetical protein